MRFSNSEVPRGGGECKQYYLVREADPSVVFYLHFGACQVVSNYSLSRFLTMGGREGGGGRAYVRTQAPPPPPPQSVLSDPRPPHPHSALLYKIRSTKGMYFYCSSQILQFTLKCNVRPTRSFFPLYFLLSSRIPPPFSHPTTCALLLFFYSPV